MSPENISKLENKNSRIPSRVLQIPIHHLTEREDRKFKKWVYALTNLKYSDFNKWERSYKRFRKKYPNYVLIIEDLLEVECDTFIDVFLIEDENIIWDLEAEELIKRFLTNVKLRIFDGLGT